jgi:hypothetical protein
VEVQDEVAETETLMENRRPSRIIEGQPQAADIFQKKSSGAGDMRGTVVWTPDRDFDDGVFAIKHNLGCKPQGFILLRGTAPLLTRVTKELLSEWSSTKVKVYVTPYVPYASGDVDIPNTESYKEVTFASPIRRSRADTSVVFGVRGGQENLSFEYSVACDFLDSGGSIATAPPFHGLRAETLAGAAVSGGDLRLRYHIFVRPGIEDEFVLQFF